MSFFTPFAFVKSTAPSGYPITPVVTSGLFADFNAWSTTSYPGSGSTWFNLTGNGNIDGVNTPVFSPITTGSSIPYFDYSTANNTFHSGSVTNFSGSGITFCVWARTPGTNSNGVVGMGNQDQGRNVWLEVATTGFLKLGLFNYDLAAGWNPTPQTITSGWNFLVVSIGLTGNVQNGYVNGTFVGTYNPNRAYSGNGTYRINSGRFADGTRGNNDVAHSLSYSKALTQTEITDLYNQYKSFYGL